MTPFIRRRLSYARAADLGAPHLLPCPFCGEACRIRRYSTAEAQAFPGQRLGGYRVTCESCCAEMKHLDCQCGDDGARCRAELTTAWNTRRSTTP